MGLGPYEKDPTHHRSMVALSIELIWIQSLLKELCLLISSLTIWCDNLSSIHLAQNPVFHSYAKNIELDLHFIRERVLRNELQILTKHQNVTSFSLLRTKLSVLPSIVSLGDDSQTNLSILTKIIIS